MLKYKIWKKLLVLNCVFVICVCVDTVQTEVVVCLLVSLVTTYTAYFNIILNLLFKT